jgi:lactoylglutathione lyase
MRRAALAAAVTLFGSLALFPAPAQAAENANPILGLAHINIQSADVEKSVQFYRDALGFTLVDTSEVDRNGTIAHYALLKLGTCVIEVSPAPQPAAAGGAPGAAPAAPGAAPAAPAPIGHFALSVSDVDKAVAVLKAKGVAIAREPSNNPQLFGGIRMVFITGPSGERIELFQFLNPASKGAQARD